MRTVLDGNHYSDKDYATEKEKAEHEFNTRNYFKHTFFTKTFLQISQVILFKNLIVLFHFNFILYLDKQLDEVITCDVVSLPLDHSFFDHNTKMV